MHIVRATKTTYWDRACALGAATHPLLPHCVLRVWREDDKSWREDDKSRYLIVAIHYDRLVTQSVTNIGHHTSIEYTYSPRILISDIEGDIQSLVERVTIGWEWKWA